MPMQSTSTNCWYNITPRRAKLENKGVSHFLSPFHTGTPPRQRPGYYDKK
ncbi:uncharacterized protein TRIVIDRAFT_227422 [Trichoderma virens Gv29-8]|uniref:Uncharacterized protein n=1 Tax=Hypocrea virens (strain Gv29-8 / FGSC 10586) TaxID=413071 RepID=G9N9E4_HYPVG|nr:uncharacterized protein TRIVIDRAFT_227422 [Trichoderma virens Gv29-8]EHK16565.1 hypothetical protein TRIVIDRAFT_227422 [Trichoderma virens Gv29-8]